MYGKHPDISEEMWHKNQNLLLLRKTKLHSRLWILDYESHYRECGTVSSAAHTVQYTHGTITAPSNGQRLGTPQTKWTHQLPTPTLRISRWGQGRVSPRKPRTQRTSLN